MTEVINKETQKKAEEIGKANNSPAVIVVREEDERQEASCLSLEKDPKRDIIAIKLREGWMVRPSYSYQYVLL